MIIIARLFLHIYVQISRLPLEWLYAVSNVFGWLMVHVRGFPINRKVRNRIEQAFPNRNEAWRRKTEKDFYRKAADFGAEFVKFISWRNDDIASHMHFKNLNMLQSLLEQYRYVVCYSGHFVNYELFTGLPMQLDHYGMYNFYDDTIRTSYPALDQWMQQLRSRCGCICIPKSSPLRDILRIHKEIESGQSQLKGFIIGSLLDTRKAGLNEQRTLIMGEEFPLHYGTEKIGRRLGAAFVYAHIACPERGQYEVTLTQLHPDANGSFMTDYINALEQNIREQPALWLMWGSL